VRNSIYRLGGMFGIDRVFSFLNRERPIILAFHGVTREAPGSIHNHDGKHLHLPIFRGLMQYVSERYRPVSLGRIVDGLERKEDLPNRAVAITFDDGYQNVLANAAPVLADLGIPATVFVVTDFCFGGRMLWTDRLISALTATQRARVRIALGERVQELPLASDADRIAADVTLRAIAKSLPDAARVSLIDQVIADLAVDETTLQRGWDDHRPLRTEDMKLLRDMNIEIGSHTCSHGIVARLSPDRMESELRDSKHRIEAATGAPCDQFSYPNGAVGDFDDRTREHARGAGYRCAVTTVKERVSRGQDPFEIPRYILTHNAITLSEFAAEVSGFPTMLRALARRFRPGATARAAAAAAPSHKPRATPGGDR
jgi:peptidoglycan/xylan/chitin deacetylase (PgdA/CDA1 family)